MLPLLLVACSSSGAPERWPNIQGIDGGFKATMPVVNDIQTGTLVVAGDSVTSHIAMAVDTGVTYVAAWYDLPDRLAETDEQDRLDTVWTEMVRHFGADARLDPGPGTGDAQGMRSAWVLMGNGTRLGAVLRVRGMRAHVLSAATPEDNFTERARANAERFFGSFAYEAP